MVRLIVGLTVVGLAALVAAAPAVGLLDGVALVRVTGAGAALMALALLPLILALALAAGGWRFVHRDLRLP